MMHWTVTCSDLSYWNYETWSLIPQHVYKYHIKHVFQLSEHIKTSHDKPSQCLRPTKLQFPRVYECHSQKWMSEHLLWLVVLWIMYLYDKYKLENLLNPTASRTMPPHLSSSSCNLDIWPLDPQTRPFHALDHTCVVPIILASKSVHYIFLSLFLFSFWSRVVY